jgi:transposase
MNEELMTVQQLAEKYNVSTKTIRRWIADAEIEPAELVIPKAGGHRIPLYSRDQVDTSVHLIETKELKSDTSKLKFMIGHIELEGTEQQRQSIREYIDNMQAQVEESKRLLLEEKAYSADVWRIANKEMERISALLRKDKAKQIEALQKQVIVMKHKLGFDKQGQGYEEAEAELRAKGEWLE